MDGLEFRRFKEADLPLFEQMVLALYREDEPGKPMSSEKVQRTAKELVLHPHKGEITLFQIKEDVVGYAILIHLWSNEYGGHIVSVDELYVKPAWRKQGIGTAFMDYISETSEAHVKAIQLEVTPTNKRALAYFMRQGLTPSANYHLLKRLRS